MKLLEEAGFSNMTRVWLSVTML